ncbi:Snf7 [Penicillium chermesinum]|nr:Snf7 [Penicillium chermesinum]
MTADTINPLDTMPASPDSEILTVSPADTSFDSPEPEQHSDDKKPAKKRKSWGQELPVPKTNLPPRKRAKTDDEKEQRRIERVLRNRAAAQTSRERKRLEMEKLETEKIRMEEQNQFLLQRLTQMEMENNRLSQQVAQLSAEVRGSRSSTPKPKAGTPVIESPTLTPTLFKQELSVAGLEGNEGPLPLFDLGAGEAPAATDVAAPLSDDDFRRLFHGDSPVESNPSFPEDGFTFGVLDGGDLSAFPFDSMVDFDPESVALEGVDPAGLPDEASHPPASMQPSLGASTSRCDGQSIAASGYDVCHAVPPLSRFPPLHDPSKLIIWTTLTFLYPQSLHLSPLSLSCVMVRKDPIFEARTNVKLHSNRLKKEAARAEATFKSEKAKADKAMKNREFQIARIHAASAVREKRRQVTLKSEAARADVIINELKAAQRHTRYLADAGDGFASAIEDVAQGVSMQEYGAEGETEVDRLMEQLADDAGVDMRMALEEGKAPEHEVKEQQPVKADAEAEDGLGARLRALRAAN